VIGSQPLWQGRFSEVFETGGLHFSYRRRDLDSQREASSSSSLQGSAFTRGSHLIGARQKATD